MKIADGFGRSQVASINAQLLPTGGPTRSARRRHVHQRFLIHTPTELAASPPSHSGPSMRKEMILGPA